MSLGPDSEDGGTDVGKYRFGHFIIKSLVFNPGDYGSKFYRIPAIVTTEDGNLLAVADKRIESMADLPGKIDVVARISEDGGCTGALYDCYRE